MSKTAFGQPRQRLASFTLAGLGALGFLSSPASAQDAKITFGPAPRIASADGQYSLALRGRVEEDIVFFDRTAGTRDFASGTDIRRARLGIDGTAAGDWAYRLEADFAGNATTVDDAYVQYKGFDHLTVTVGQQKAPTSLERLTSGNYLTFMERGMAVEAFTNATNAGGDYKLGGAAGYVGKDWTLTAGVFGDNIANGSQPGDDSYGYHARATVAPVNTDGYLLHLGVSGFWRDAGGRHSVRFGDRPEIRVDNTRLVDTGAVDTDHYTLVDGEAIAAAGPAFVQGEYLKTHVSRYTAGNPALDFDGYYIAAGWFLTGEHLAYRDGNLARLKPKHDFSPGGGFGAFELAARYSKLDLDDKDIAGGNAHDVTVGLNWYANSYVRVMLNWVHFDTTRQGADTNGNAFGARFAVNW